MPVVLDADRMARSLARIAHEILERNSSPGNIAELALVGIRTRGVPLARRIAKSLQDISHHEIPTGALDITLYRDDLSSHTLGPQPLVRKTEIPFSIDGKLILLVDRGHRELPIKADYVGKNIPTASTQNVQVHLMEIDGRDEVEVLP